MTTTQPRPARSHVLDAYPPWGAPMNEPGDNLLALFVTVLPCAWLGGLLQRSRTVGA